MMDPVTVSKSDPAYGKSQSKLADVSPEALLVPCQDNHSRCAERKQQGPFRCDWKSPPDAVFLHRGVIWLYAQANIMLASADWHYLRQVALCRVGADQAEFLFGEPVIWPA